MAEVIKVASDMGGSVLSSTTSGEKSGTFTLRIPARNFENAMLALRPLGTVMASQEVGKDVTSQFVDLKAHMRILFGRRAVILKLMSQATTISDTLVVQNQYDNTQLQIDQYQGQLNVIRNQVAESTVTVSLAGEGFAEDCSRGRRLDTERRQIVPPWLAGVPACHRGGRHRARIPDPDRRAVRHRVDGQGVGAEASRSQLSDLNLSAAIDASAESSPPLPSVAPNQASASIHAASI